MKSITIHGIDEPLVRLIESRAQAQGLSVNKTIKKVLEEAFGIKPRHRAANRSEFEEFCGLWSESELAEFEERTRDLRKIDPEDWKYSLVELDYENCERCPCEKKLAVAYQ